MNSKRLPIIAAYASAILLWPVVLYLAAYFLIMYAGSPHLFWQYSTIMVDLIEFIHAI